MSNETIRSIRNFCDKEKFCFIYGMKCPILNECCEDFPTINDDTTIREIRKILLNTKKRGNNC